MADRDPSDNTDRLFGDGRAAPGSFRFDARVARVFDDMIRRSVPGYASTVTFSGWLAGRFAQPGTACYDLGCSLGATLLACSDAIAEALGEEQAATVQLFGVDNAEAMLAGCRQRLERLLGARMPTLIEADLRQLELLPSSVIILNWTLQFVPPDDRSALLQRIHDALVSGGVLILSEKVVDEDARCQNLLEELHLDFKRAQGYSELEIAAKRSAIEQVLIPETLASHRRRLQTIGFDAVLTWQRQLNFASLLAVKP